MKNDKEIPVRQLIRFSNYSLCITLPKEYIDGLGWQQGDRIEFLLDKNSNGLILSRQAPIQSPLIQSPLITIHEEKEILNSTREIQTGTPESSDDLSDGLSPIPLLN